MINFEQEFLQLLNEMSSDDQKEYDYDVDYIGDEFIEISAREFLLSLGMSNEVDTFSEISGNDIDAIFKSLSVANDIDLESYVDRIEMLKSLI